MNDSNMLAEEIVYLHKCIKELNKRLSAALEQNAALISQAMTTDSQNIALNADYERCKKELDEARKEIENYRHRIIHDQY